MFSTFSNIKDRVKGMLGGASKQMSGLSGDK